MYCVLHYVFPGNMTFEFKVKPNHIRPIKALQYIYPRQITGDKRGIKSTVYSI
jgi:hypothetical protein